MTRMRCSEVPDPHHLAIPDDSTLLCARHRNTKAASPVQGCIHVYAFLTACSTLIPLYHHGSLDQAVVLMYITSLRV